MTREDEALARVLLGGKHLEETLLEKAKKLQREKFPNRDLGWVLVHQKLLDKEKLAVAQRLAKMAAPAARAPRKASTPPASSPADAPPPPPDAPSPTDAEIAELPTPLMTPRAERPPERAVTRFQDRTHFGRYEVVEKIARGGMGVVYKVRHPGLDRLFALKVLSQGEDADEEVLERFRREAKTAARLDHPSIVRVHDAGTEDGFPYIVMDLVEGDSLAKILKDEGVSPRKGALVSRSIARALAHAHEHGIVHRDVKPDNVLIERLSGEARLSDFGIVKDLRGDGDAKLTKTGLTLGSPCYMSPEQAAGRHDQVGPASDVYSLGATLYEMLAGRPPFEGDSIHGIMVKVVHDDPVPPRRTNPAVHPELEAICLKALEKDPRRRYGSATALAEDLERYVEGRPVLARPAGPGTKLLRLARRHRGVALTGVVLAAVAGWLAVSEVRSRRLAHEQRVRRIELATDEAELALARARRTDLAELETRRAYRDAIRLFDRVLDEAPDSARARGGKLDAILGLADRLLERREAGFAEYVLDQAEGLAADTALITSRRDLARKSEWVQKAEAAELKGELDEALRLLREGLRALKAAGLTGELLEQKIEDLDRQLAARRRDEEVKSLVDQGERNESAGDLAAALDLYRQALSRRPEDATLPGRVQLLDARVRRSVEQALDAAATDADRAKTALPAGAVSRPDLSNELEQGASLDRSAREKLQKGEYASALDLARRAQSAYRVAQEIARALAAREDARGARLALQKKDSASYAESEVRRGKEREDAGEARLAASEFARARADFVEASTYYRLASNQGEIKQSVAVAREAARDARARAQTQLPESVVLQAVRDAGSVESEAAASELTGDLRKARELWGKAAGLWSQAEQLAPAVNEALAAREKARVRKGEADAEQAAEYDAPDVDAGRTAWDDGDQNLRREEFARATERYGKAEYYWKQAASKAAPFSRPKRRIEALRKATEEARARAKAKDRQGTRRWNDAEEFFAKGEDAEKRKYWRGAEDYYGRAKSLYEDLAPPDR